MDSTTRELPYRTPSHFLTTSWTLISQASGEDASSRDAMAALCRDYWNPLFLFYQRYSATTAGDADGEDLVQSFFAWLIESNLIQHADEERGRFRTFLLASFKRFLAKEYQYRSAAKRRPDMPIVSIDDANWKNTASIEPFHNMTPDRVFDYAWAMELIDRSMQRLSEEWSITGRSHRFEVLKKYLSGSREIRGRELAKELGMTEGAVRVAIHRLRQRFAELLRDEVRKTAHCEDDVDAELNHLLRSLGGA